MLYRCDRGHAAEARPADPQECRYVLENCDEVGCAGGHEPGAHMGRYCDRPAGMAGFPLAQMDVEGVPS